MFMCQCYSCKDAGIEPPVASRKLGGRTQCNSCEVNKATGCLVVGDDDALRVPVLLRVSYVVPVRHVSDTRETRETQASQTGIRGQTARRQRSRSIRSSTSS
jgi:hypothetical protein